MTSSTDHQIDHILRVFLRLLDLSRDLERNYDDSTFKSESGSIHYVFDADLFEVFVRPWIARGRTASLHTRPFNVDDLGAPMARHWHSVAAQTALSATEYLVSGTLPAQHDVRIYMTLEHRWELARRTSRMASDWAQLLPKPFGQQRTIARFKNAAALRTALKSNPNDWSVLKASDPLLHSDLDQLQSLPRNAFLQFACTRTTLRELCEDRTVEPAEQVARIVAPNLRRQFATLHQVFPLAPNEEELVAADARRWFDLFIKEARLQGIAIHDASTADDADETEDGGVYRGRKRGALWDDAKSLATVRWIARRGLGGKSRLVFVSADELVFDAYRRWYANLSPSDGAYSEPFLLRRLIQYAPMFNLTDIGKLSGERAREVFRGLRHLLEVNLLTLNLSRLNARPTSEPIMTRMRELTALRRTDPAPISSDPAYASLASAIRTKLEKGELDDMNNVLNDLRFLERISLGQFDEHVRIRLGEREARDLGLTEKTGEKQIVKYVSNLVHKMLSVSVRLWFPLAREFIDAWRPRKGVEIIRAPVAVRLQVMVDNRVIDIGEALNRKLANSGDDGGLLPPDTWKHLAGDEPIIFGIAGVLALASADWSNAEHFSEMAEKAQQGQPRGDERLAEYRYLSAISNRFRIGVHGVPNSPDALNKVLRTYETAKTHLDWCVNFHESHRQWLRLLRSVSERAALKLFFVSCITASVREAAAKELTVRHEPPKSLSNADMHTILDSDPLTCANQTLSEAEADLRRCLEIDASHSQQLVPDRGEAIRVIRRQYLANICSASLARSLLGLPQGAHIMSPANDALAGRVREFLSEHKETAHGLLRGEMLAFLAIGGDTKASHEIQRMAPLPKEALALDRALLSAAQAAAGRGF